MDFGYSFLKYGITNEDESAILEGGNLTRLSTGYAVIYDTGNSDAAVALKNSQAETVLITAINTVTGAVSFDRAQLGTTAQFFNQSGRSYKIFNSIHSITFENIEDELDEHVADTNNPHNVTKSQVGLGNVNNTADSIKEVSVPQQDALDLKANKANILVPIMLPSSTGCSTPNTTTYITINSGASAGVTTESNAGFLLLKSGILKNLSVYITGNAGITSYTVTARINGSDTAIVVAAVINAVTTDSTHSVAVTAGQRLTFKVVTGANGSFTPSLQAINLDFQPEQ